jgi:uncharacterized membrane protein
MNTELLIATFAGDEAKASEALAAVKKLHKDGSLKMLDAATIVKNKDGEIEQKDVHDVDSKHGAIFGAITGGLLGLFAGPVGAAIGAAAGAATGGATAKLADYGVSEGEIKETANNLEPGSSAIILYLELQWADKAVKKLEENGGRVYRETLSIDAISNRGNPDDIRKY